MRLRVVVALMVMGTLYALLPLPANATTPNNKGLYVTPSRDYAVVSPGHQVQKQITIANNTDAPLSVALTIQQFSVADYSYDYRFQDVRDDWLKLDTTQVDLQPGKSQNVTYTLAPQSGTAPGGHYFTIFATATVGGQSQVRTATVLYVTVSGNTQATSNVQSTTIPRVAFGDIPFTLQVKDTGNTHFFIYVSGKVADRQSSATTHLLMPQAIRQVGGTIPAPLWPGIYTATYGFTTDSGNNVMRSTRIVYVPLWSILVAIGLLGVGLVLFGRWRRQRPRRHIKDF